VVIPHVEGCAENTVPASQTHLPRNRKEGDIPLYAIVTGGFDPLECLMRKIGVDDEEFTGATGPGRIHLYQGMYGGGAASSLPAVALYPQINRYDAVLLACEGDTYPDNKPLDAAISMLDFLNMGGRVYASHFQYYWFAPSPLGAGVPPLPTVGQWDLNASIDDSINAKVDVSFPKGLAYFNWLSHVGAIGVDGLISIESVRRDIDYAVSPLAQSWIHSDAQQEPPAVQMLTFNAPVGVAPQQQCGRAVFSDMHVASNDLTGQIFPQGCITTGLSSQEKALEFMLFDLSSCIQEDGSPASPPLK
jgi:hypothetical protein